MPSRKHSSAKPRGRDTGKASRPAPHRTRSVAAAPAPPAVDVASVAVEQSRTSFAGPATHSMGYFSQGVR